MLMRQVNSLSYILSNGIAEIRIYWNLRLVVFIVNLCKVPLMIDLKIITADSIGVSAWMFIPAVIGVTAPFFVKFLNQKIFESLIWFFIVLAGLRMLV